LATSRYGRRGQVSQRLQTYLPTPAEPDFRACPPKSAACTTALAHRNLHLSSFDFDFLATHARALQSQSVAMVTERPDMKGHRAFFVGYVKPKIRGEPLKW